MRDTGFSVAPNIHDDLNLDLDLDLDLDLEVDATDAWHYSPGSLFWLRTDLASSHSVKVCALRGRLK